VVLEVDVELDDESLELSLEVSLELPLSDVGLSEVDAAELSERSFEDDDDFEDDFASVE
jgi:hypothetical protein